MEAWKVIPGFTRYSVSDQGRVRRDVPIYRTPAGQCAQRLHLGYPIVALTSDTGVSGSHFVHRLVMLAFVGPLPDGMHTCHADGDRSNTRLSNLRYDSPEANVRDAIRHGTQVRGEQVHQHILSEANVIEIVRRLDTGSAYVELAADFGVTKSTIYRIAIGSTWRHLTGGVNRRTGYKFNSRGALAAKAKRALLRAAALAEPNGHTRATPSGGKSRVWRAI